MTAINSCAIFGGTFDPIHRGHLHLITSVLKTGKFDQLFVVPAGEPNLRITPVASKGDRLRMLELALSDLPTEISHQIRISDIEIVRNGPTYSVDTVKELQLTFNAQWTLIIGSDVLNSLPQWHAFQELCSLVEFLVVKRPGSDVANIPGVRMSTIEIDALDISATKVRTALAAGSDINTFISPRVVEYIKEQGLYARA